MLATSPVPHSACRQLHAIDGLPAEPPQFAPQYLLPGGAGQLQPGCAHFPIFFSAIETPLAPFSVAEKHTPTLTQNQSRLNPAHRTWKIPRRESLTTPPKPFAPMTKSGTPSPWAQAGLKSLNSSLACRPIATANESLLESIGDSYDPDRQLDARPGVPTGGLQR